MDPSPCRFPRSAPREYSGLPCYLPEIPPDVYADVPSLEPYLERLRYIHLAKVSIYENLLRDELRDGARVLSAGEGTGEYIASLALKYPRVDFYAFDYTANRVVIARELMRHLGVENVSLYIGSVEEIPFEDGFFAAAVERGVFHVLPREVKLKNLSELERTCSGKVILGHMTNARPYLIKRWIQSKRRSDRRIWEDAHTTYRAIDPQHNSLVKIAKLVEEVTGHPARVLYYFDGDQELSWPKPRRRMLLPYLGGVMYDTRT